jgi:hypothetical protein
MPEGFVMLKAPPGAVPSDVHLLGGRQVRPDGLGQIHVAPGEAAPLLAHGWQLVQPVARWKPPA